MKTAGTVLGSRLDVAAEVTRLKFPRENAIRSAIMSLVTSAAAILKHALTLLLLAFVATGSTADNATAQPGARPEGPPGVPVRKESTQPPVGWRGDGSGQYPSANPAMSWSATNNVRWKATVGNGQSSPIVVGQRLFVTAEPDLLICLETETGKELWRKAHKLSDLAPLRKEPAALNGEDRAQSSPYGDATPTPVSDGKRLWAFFGPGIVACHDLDGKTRWMNSYDLPQNTTGGRTASPLLIGDRLLIHFGVLACLDAATGKLLWTNNAAKASYGTPVLARIGDVEVVITPKGHVVRVADGKTLASDLGNCTYTSPVVQDRIVYFIEGTMTAAQLPEQAAGARAGALECKELWSAELTGEFFASPLVHGGRLYTIDKASNFYVIDLRTGKIIRQKKLPWPSAERADGARAEAPNAYPSLCLAGKHLVASNDAGDTLLLEPGDHGAVIGASSLPRGSGATPTFSGTRMFIRGDNLIYCIDGQTQIRGQ
jgi:outer membrane protein assembly factor BamB